MAVNLTGAMTCDVVIDCVSSPYITVNAAGGASESYGEELSTGMFSFATCLFRYHGTVLPKIMPQTLFAVFVAMIAQAVKIFWCGVGITSPSECPLAFSQTAHSVAGGIIGFMLVFRTSISYYRFYEGKKYLGQLYDSVRNANIAFCSFMRSAEDGDVMQRMDAGGNRRRSRFKGGGATATFVSFDGKLNKDRVELRRLSSVLYAFIRQAIREHRHGYPVDCSVTATDASLVEDDLFGRPSLGLLLSDEEKDEYKAIDFNNRANLVVWKMQSIVEHHRRLGHISERGAFDIYHDLEGCLEAYKHMERIVSTKMPFQYLHMVNFLLFIFVFSAPFVFTTGFKWLSPIPSCIVAISFYGVAEVARSIEDPYSWVKPCHDLTGVGWRLYAESLQLHEASVADVDAAAGSAEQAHVAEQLRVSAHTKEHHHPRGAAPAAAAQAAEAAAVDATGATRTASFAANGDAASRARTESVTSVDGIAVEPRRLSVRQSVAHGAVDVVLLSSQQPSAEVGVCPVMKTHDVHVICDSSRPPDQRRPRTGLEKLPPAPINRKAILLDALLSFASKCVCLDER